MKKNILVTTLLVMVLITGLVSAGWWTDFWRNAPSPEDSQEGDVQFSPSNFGLKDLEEGVKLEKGWNYWYTWDDEDVSIKEATSGLESLKYILSYSSEFKEYFGYWYPDGKQPYSEFQKGRKYALRMEDYETWKYSDVVISKDFGDLEFKEMTSSQDCDILDDSDNDGECLKNYEVKYGSKEQTTLSFYLEQVSQTISDKDLIPVLKQAAQGSLENWELTDSDLPGYIYVIDAGEEILAIWNSESWIIALEISEEDLEYAGEEYLVDAITAYLNKYPSDLTSNSPLPQEDSDSSDDSSSGGGGGSSSSGNGVTVYTKSEVDSMMEQSSSESKEEYVDFTSCEFEWEKTSEIRCKTNQVIGAVTHQDCNNGNQPRIVGTGWNSNRIPDKISYRCADNSTPLIAYHCCDVKNVRATREKHSTKLDSSGDIVLDGNTR